MGLGGEGVSELIYFTFICLARFFEPILELEEGGGGGCVGLCISGFILPLIGVYICRLVVGGGLIHPIMRKEGLFDFWGQGGVGLGR